MSNYFKIRSPWSQLGLFLGSLGGALLLFGIIASAILALTGKGASHLNVDDPASVGTLKWLQAASSIAIFGIPALLFATMTYYRRPIYHLGFRPAHPAIFYVLGIVLLLVSLPLESWLGVINKHLPLPVWMTKMEKENDRQIIAFLKTTGPIDVIINLVVMALLPAIFEEVCFRGVMQGIFIRMCKNPWAGIVIGGAFFSAFHQQFEGFFPRMLLGILLGAAYYYSRSLWPGILAHLFYNGIQVAAAAWYPKMITENPDASWTMALLSLALVVGLLIYMRRISSVSYEQDYAAGEEKSAFDQFMEN